MSTLVKLLATAVIGAGVFSVDTAVAADKTVEELLAAMERQEKRAKPLRKAGERRGVALAPAPSRAAPQAQPQIQAQRAVQPRQAASQPVEVQTVAATAEAYEPLPRGDTIDLVVKFHFNSDQFLAESVPVLNTLCQAIQQSPDDRVFEFIGHTDATGPDVYNDSLSLRRARAVELYVTQSCDVTPNRVYTYGLGERSLIPNLPSNAPQQRRVEIRRLTS